MLVQDADSGRTLDDATIVVELTSPDHALPPLRAIAVTDAATNQLFRAALFDLPTPGEWHVRVECTTPAHPAPATVAFTMNAAAPLPPWLTVWPWFTWPAVAVLLFAIHRVLVKRRQTRRSLLGWHAQSVKRWAWRRRVRTATSLATPTPTPFAEPQGRATQICSANLRNLQLMKRRQPKPITPGPRTPPVDSSDERSSLTALALLSLLAGAAAGLLGACFRRLLDEANTLRGEFIDWAHAYSYLGMALVVALVAAATAFAAWLVRRFSHEASGSGIPHVEAVLHETKPPASYAVLPVKFFGGLAAIGAGLALGREGPTVQMGASAAHLVGTLFRRNAADARILLAAGAGAGLATAFNAPIAGSVFVLEELMRRFDTRITIATLGASAAAISVSRLLLGDAPDFLLEPLPYPAIGSTPVFIVFGLFVGLLGIGYNRAILGCMAFSDRLSRFPVELRAAAVGAAVGLLAWFAPTLVGGGDPITSQALHNNAVLTLLPAVFALRFALGAVSYAAGTPGGLFAPMLVLGASGRPVLRHVRLPVASDRRQQPSRLRRHGHGRLLHRHGPRPVTGIILVIELTGSDTQLLSLLAACFTAMLVPTILGNRPIYDSLGERP